MKRFLLIALTATFAFGLVACQSNEDPLECGENEIEVDGECVEDTPDEPTPDPDTTAPVFSGVEDVTIFLEEAFEPTSGVSATDNVDGDITDDIVVSGVVDNMSPGTYFLKYSITDSSGNKTEAVRYVTVEVDPSLIGDEMVPNGNFDLGWAVWGATTGLEGGTANYTVVDGVLEVEITGVSGGLWEPRLENSGIAFENGVTYLVQFEAKALAPRSIHVQVGELLASAPWFTNFKPGQTEIFDLSTEWQTFSFKFTMGLDTNENGGLYFEMGTVTGDVGTDNLLTTVYMDNVTIEESTPDPDTISPVISGIDNVTIDLGTEFDALTGVSAIDNFDGDITDLVVVEGTVDINTVAEYTLTYTVEDAAGNSVTETRLVNVREPLGGEDTDQTAGWRAFTNNWEGTAGELVAIDDQLVLDLTAINAMDANWKIQIIQDAFALGTGPDNAGSIEFVAGNTYKVTFDAKASVAGDVNVAIGHAGNGWTEYYAELVSVTTELATYEVTFTLDDAEMDYTTLAQFKLEMGLLFAGETSGQFTLDNVVIYVLEGEEFIDAELIENGDFDAPNYVAGWRAFTNSWEGTVGEIIGMDDQLVLDLTAINAMDANWKIQVIQDAFALGTGPDNAGSIEFVAGNTYKVMFDAKASVAGDVNVAIGHAGNGWTEYYAELVSVTTELATYEVTFTLDDAEMDYTTLAQFKLEMGLLFAGETSGQFTLDNVVIYVLEGEEFVDAELIENGDFNAPDLTAGWRAFTNNWEGTAGELVAMERQLVLDLTAINAMDANWKIQIIQDAFALGTGPDNAGSIEFVAGNTYKVTFDAKASVAGDVNVAIGHAGNGWTEYYAELVSVTTELATYEVTFTLDDAEMDYTTLAQFKLEMGLLFAGETSGQFTLDNVVIYVLEGEEFIDAELIENGDFQ